MMRFILISVLVSVCVCRPNENVSPQNVVTVPPNCPPGQQWINGQCRDIWRIQDIYPSNVVSVPPNCPPGQQYINGQCRDVWIIKSKTEGLDFAPFIDKENKNVISVPPNCIPPKQLINGQCRDVWHSADLVNPPNVVTVPPNCPAGQQYINGQCRDVWSKDLTLEESKMITDILNELGMGDLMRRIRQADDEIISYENDGNEDETNRNIISVPNQCPNGFRPDALGVCREIFEY